MSEGWVEAAFEAARSGDVETVVRLIEPDSDRVRRRTEHDLTFLHIAAERDDVRLAEALLERGAEVNAIADWGQTPFEWAANMNSSKVAALLLEHGGERLDLWTASALGMLDVVKGYFANGTPAPGAGRRPRPGATLDHWPEDSAFLAGDEVSDAFYIACRNGRREVAEFLKDRGADIGAKGYFGATALHWAAGRGHREVVDWLIAQGADRAARDPRFGGTPAGWAREFGHVDLAQHMEEDFGE